MSLVIPIAIGALLLLRSRGEDPSLSPAPAPGPAPAPKKKPRTLEEIRRDPRSVEEAIAADYTALTKDALSLADAYVNPETGRIVSGAIGVAVGVAAGGVAGGAAVVAGEAAAAIAELAGVKSPQALFASRLAGSLAVAAFLFGGVFALVGVLLLGAAIVVILELYSRYKDNQTDAQATHDKTNGLAFRSIEARVLPLVSHGKIPDDATAYRVIANLTDGFAYEVNRLKFESWMAQNGNDADFGYDQGHFCGYPITMPDGQHPYTHRPTPRPNRYVDSYYQPPPGERNVHEVQGPFGSGTVSTMVTDIPFIEVFEAGRRAANVASYVAWMNGIDYSAAGSDVQTYNNAAANRFADGIRYGAFVATGKSASPGVLVYEGATYNWREYK